MSDTYRIRRNKLFRWEPKEDITAYELALAVKALLHGVDVEVIYNSLPPGAQRHIEPETEPE